MRSKQFFRRAAWSVLTLFILVNIFAGFHAYKFTHFSNTTAPRTDPRRLSIAGKLKTIFFGVDNPRPSCGNTGRNGYRPSGPFCRKTCMNKKPRSGPGYLIELSQVY